MDWVKVKGNFPRFNQLIYPQAALNTKNSANLMSICFNLFHFNLSNFMLYINASMHTYTHINIKEMTNDDDEEEVDVIVIWRAFIRH